MQPFDVRLNGNGAEDALQDAFAVALASWPRDGVPRVPGAWITTTARRRAIDRLRLVFTCCHAALMMDARVALTLRMLGGLSTAEVARAVAAYARAITLTANAVELDELQARRRALAN